MQLTNEQIIKRYHEQQNKQKTYWLKFKIENRIRKRKCDEQNITVSQHEIVNDPEYVAYVKSLKK